MLTSTYLRFWQNVYGTQFYSSKLLIFTPQSSGLEGYCHHGPGGWAGGCQTCGTHISVTAWWIFTVRSSVELSRPVVVHCHGHLPICPIWACPWAKNLSNLAQIGSRLCGTHISETTGCIYPIWSFMDLSGPVGLWGFLWWAPSAKGKDHHGVSSGWSSVWHRSNTGLSSTQYEQIPIILGIWPFWLTPFFFRSITFWRAYG